jgi:hypothetical protein
MRGSTMHHYQNRVSPEPCGCRVETIAEIPAGVPTGGQIRQEYRSAISANLPIAETYRESDF